MIASLLDHFHLTLPQISALTDRQLVSLYFHARDKEGRIEEVVETPRGTGLAVELLRIDHLAAQLRLRPENVEAMKDRIRERYAAGE